MFKDFWNHADRSGKFAVSFALALVGFGLLIYFIFIVMLLVHFSFDVNKPMDMEHTGQIGDYLSGVVGTLFALVGASLLFATLIVQSKQMRIQMEEQARTNDNLRIQNNLQIFNYHLQTRQVIINNIEYSDG